MIELAAQVITQADRQHPADAVLRQTLRGARGVSAIEAGEISRAVFAYYRWCGWLADERNVPARITRAMDLAEQFRNNPLSISIESLRANAVPEWTGSEVIPDDAWLRSLQSEPTLWLRARRGQGRGLAKKLGDCQPFGTGPLEDVLEYRGATDLFRTSEFHSGEFEVQDITSQAVGFMCNPHPGETWWDACAGEGGKMLHLADLMENKGLIWASDRAAWRLQRLKRRAARAKVFNYRAALWDGAARLPTKTKFDGVLVDAPCSGIGTWQRNPHARWTTTLDDVRELAGVQQRMLVHAAASLKPGGKLFYAVCTLARSETTGVAGEFARQCPHIEPLVITNPLQPEIASAQITLLPQQFGGNGMFVAAWQLPRTA
jgi:16S rRNA (cytosine967-C5)-methyltransferase